MASTFFGLNIGASALNAYQVAVNTTANNISNIETEGYSRQSAYIKASASLRMCTRYGSAGTGVEVTEIKQERDLYYDTKYWNNNSSYGYYEQKLYNLDQMLTYFKDDETVSGFSSIITKMFSSLDSVKTNASETSVRNQFISDARSLCTYFNQMSQSLSELQNDCNEEIKNAVDQINAIAEKISLLNKEINQIETGTGAYASELRDERARIIDTLSKVVNVTYTETEVQNSDKDNDNLGGTVFTLNINGEVLVNGNNYRKLVCQSKQTKNNQTDIDGLYYIYWSDTKMPMSATAGTSGGSLKALFEMRDGDNNEHLKGTVTEAGTDEETGHEFFKISASSVKNINGLNIPDRDGSVSVGNKSFDYDSWEAEVDGDGNIVSIKFILKDYERPDNEVAAVQNGYSLTCGSRVEGMGIPYYQAQMNEFIRNFTEMFNEIEKTGQTLTGEKSPAFFEGITKTGMVYDFAASETYQNLGEGDAPVKIKSDDNTYYRLMASNIGVNQDVIKDPGLFGACTDYTKPDSFDVIEKLLKLESDTTMYRGDKASAFLETLISDVSVDTNKAEIYYDVYSNLEKTINNQRASVSGVDEDEEGVNLVKFQNAYNMSSKIIQIMQEMLDKLINETAV